MKKKIIRYVFNFSECFSKKKTFNSLKTIDAVKIHVSNSCNLRCKYCYANEGNYGYESSIMNEKNSKKNIHLMI